MLHIYCGPYGLGKRRHFPEVVHIQSLHVSGRRTSGSQGFWAVRGCAPSRSEGFPQDGRQPPPVDGVPRGFLSRPAGPTGEHVHAPAFFSGPVWLLVPSNGKEPPYAYGYL
jgi:hypothetical protein